MERDKSLRDYLEGFRVGLSGKRETRRKVKSLRAWVDGFEAGRSALEKAQRTVSIEYVGLQAIRLDRHDLL